MARNWEVNDVQMRGYIDIKGYGENDLSSEITIRRKDSVKLDSSVEIQKKYEVEELVTNIQVVQKGRTDLITSIMISPNLVMRGYVDIIEPPKKVMRVYPNKDSTIRESAPILNYGHSPQMLAGQESGGKLISYLGFDIELPSNFDEMVSAKLVLNKEYPTSSLFFMGIHEVSDDWLEEFITWNYSPTKETYVNQFVIPREIGEVRADITQFVGDWGDGRKSITLHPRNYSVSELTTFSTKESSNPPYIEITYYEHTVNANTVSIDAEMVVAKQINRDIQTSIEVVSDYHINELPIELEIPSRDVNEYLDTGIEVSIKGVTFIDLEIEIPRYDGENFIDTEFRIPYIEELDTEIVLEEIEGGEGLDTDLVIKAFTDKVLDSELEIKSKGISKDIEVDLIVKVDNYFELDTEILIENKDSFDTIEVEMLIGVHEIDSIDSDFEIVVKDDYTEIDAEFNVRGVVELDSEIEISFIEDKKELDVEFIVPYIDDLDTDFIIETKDIQSDISMVMTMTRKDLKTEIDGDMIVRAFNAGEIESTLIIERRFEIDTEIEVRVGGGDYAFIM